MFSGNRENLGSIKDLTRSEKVILEALLEWDFQKIKANAFNIANETGLGFSTVQLGLKVLKARNLIIKSPSGMWHLISEISQQLKEELKIKEQSQQT